LLNTLRYARDPLGFLPRLRERYGDMFTVRFPIFGEVVYVAAPGPAKELFMHSPRDLHAGEANATVLEPAVGPSSVLTLDDDAHLRQRKILLAPFHGRAIENYRAVIAEAAARDLDRWPVGTPFALRDRMQRVTLDVILRAVYGLDEASFSDAHAIVDEFTTASDALMIPAPLQRGRFGPWGRFLRARAALDRMVYATIAARRAAGDAGERDDVLSLLMRSRDEDGNAATDRELRDELVTIVGAGHETTATALSWAVERLVRHPAALARLREGDDDYLDAVIRETLRVRPVIVDVARKATRDVTIGGYDLPAGTLVLVAITAMHYRADLYPEPRAFRPERFLETPPETYSWLPFGGGVRRCLGAAFAHEEMRIVLREIVSRADLHAVSPRDERVRLRNITLAPREGATVVARSVAARAAAGQPVRLAISSQ
jgi:cytochrome P450